MTCTRDKRKPTHTAKITLSFYSLRFSPIQQRSCCGGRRSYSKNTHACTCVCVALGHQRSYLCNTGDHRSAQIFSTACPVRIVPRATLRHRTFSTQTPPKRDQNRTLQPPHPQTTKTTQPSASTWFTRVTSTPRAVRTPADRSCRRTV